MRLRVLGSSGASMPGYDTTSFLLNNSILLDAGTVTSVLSLEEQARIGHIFITHSHLDHVKDLLFLADNLIGYVDGSVNIFSTREILDAVKMHLFNQTIWPDFAVLPNEDRPILKLLPIEAGRAMEVEGLRITPIRTNHTVPSVGYMVEEGEKAIIYTGDTGPTEGIWEVARDKEGLMGIFIETSFPSSMEKIAGLTGHLTPSTLVGELEKLGRDDVPIYIYHIKPQYIEEISSELKGITEYPIVLVKGGEEFLF